MLIYKPFSYPITPNEVICMFFKDHYKRLSEIDEDINAGDYEAAQKNFKKFFSEMEKIKGALTEMLRLAQEIEKMPFTEMKENFTYAGSHIKNIGENIENGIKAMVHGKMEFPEGKEKDPVIGYIHLLKKRLGNIERFLDRIVSISKKLEKASKEAEKEIEEAA